MKKSSRPRSRPPMMVCPRQYQEDAEYREAFLKLARLALMAYGNLIVIKDASCTGCDVNVVKADLANDAWFVGRG